MARTRLTRRNHPAEKWLGKKGEEELVRTETMKDRALNKYANIVNIIYIQHRLVLIVCSGFVRGTEQHEGLKTGDLQKDTERDTHTKQ